VTAFNLPPGCTLQAIEEQAGTFNPGELTMADTYDKMNAINDRVGELKLGTEQADDSLGDCVRELTEVCAALLRRIEALEVGIMRCGQ
jgi:hypothetical protein